MANLTGTPTYVNVLRQLETTDPAHPNTWNPNYQALLNNDVYIKKLIDNALKAIGGHDHSGVDGQGTKIPISSIAEDIATQAELNAHIGSRGSAHAIVTTTEDGFMSKTDKSKLDGIATGANNYVHPTGDGNLHVPATSTTNAGKVLKAGATAGSLSWGTLTAADVGALPSAGTAVAATKLATARTIALTGDVSGSATFDGSSNISITATVADDSHAHVIANVDGLQAALDAKQATLAAENRRKITFGTVAPTGGVDGDIYLQYE